MKSTFFIALVSALWTLSFFPAAQPDLSGLVREHVFFSSSVFTLSARSFDSKKVEQTLIKTFCIPKELQLLGFSLRGWALQIPDWLFLLPDPRLKTKINILIREEVADEFNSPQLSESYRDSLSAMTQSLGQFEKKYGLRPRLLLVPTKIFANGLHPQWTQARLQDQEFFSIEQNSRLRPAGEAQKSLETELEKNGEFLISILDLYTQLRERFYPLYSFGESHWSQEVVESVAAVLLSNLVQKNAVDRNCYDTHLMDEEAPADLKPFFGDLAEIIGIDRLSPLGRAVTTESRESRIRPAQSDKLSQRNSRCPDIFYIGTSYGNVHAGHGSITEVMTALYQGHVYNHSVSGMGPLTAMEKFESPNLLATGNTQPNLSAALPEHSEFNPALAPPSKPTPVVIWEMPFRYVKDIGLRDGRAYYPVQRHLRN